MTDQINLEMAREHFALAIPKAGVVPKAAHVTIHPANGEATAFHYTWPISANPKKISREVTVKVASKAMTAFRSGSAAEREAMLGRFLDICATRLQEGGYDPAVATVDPFIVTIDQPLT